MKHVFFRYETRVFLKNSGVSYLYGSISYLFGYEKNRCFSLMLVLFVMHIVEYCSLHEFWRWIIPYHFPISGGACIREKQPIFSYPKRYETDP